MITISLCMIVKNKEKVLNRCLQSIKDIPDEIIIIDTGSMDQTKEMSKK
ncbi:Glycosyl transferase family 2 [Bacillus subtilis]|nr:Glycosyl transferase family 2 [Bacillus subtilis]